MLGLRRCPVSRNVPFLSQWGPYALPAPSNPSQPSTVLLQSCVHDHLLRHQQQQQQAQLGTLVVAETISQVASSPSASTSAVRPSLANAVAAAQEFKEPVTVLVGGAGGQCIATEQAQRIKGCSQVLAVEHPTLNPALAEPWTALLLWLIKKEISLGTPFSRVLSASSTFSRSLLPRAAALLDAPMLSDVIQIQSHDTFVRPIYAGNALATVQTHSPSSAPLFLTVRPTAFPPAPLAAEGEGLCPSSTVEFKPEDLKEDPALSAALLASGKSAWQGQEVRTQDRPDLSAAKVVVSGGRGLRSAEGFAMLEALADKLGGAVGASRAAVDAGFAPNELQVGQTGKVVAPDLYVAVGISGAIQHLAGMKDSKTIVAVNKDPDAPIFQVADYGIVGDLFKVIPEFAAKIKT